MEILSKTSCFSCSDFSPNLKWLFVEEDTCTLKYWEIGSYCN